MSYHPVDPMVRYFHLGRKSALQDPTGERLDRNESPIECLMDVEAVARALGVSKKFVYVNHKTDGPPAIKIGNLLRWRPSDVLAYLNGKAAGTAAAREALRP
jgi:predicted DNA-binding transcriptional regulator AlpA